MKISLRFILNLVGVALLLVLEGCGTAPRVEQRPDASSPQSTPSRVSPDQAADITVYAIGLVGTPYRHGGNTPQAGFDCSGLIGYVYQTRAGVAVPRTVAKMQNWGQPVSNDSLRSGDLVLFSQNDLPTHAGIYVGSGRFVHAPSTGGEVRLDSLNSKYWKSQYQTFRRP
jgi:cell wall-associated NlpC family hydrolase